MTTVRRFDRGEFRKAARTPQGFLKVDGRVSRTGILEYKQPDGTTRHELRLADDVFHPDSLASIQLAPVTLEHPGEKVTAENVKRYGVGMTGESVERDGDFVKAPLLITDAAAIAAIERGEKRELSVGYEVEIEENPGTWKGQHYDGIQRSIRANHVAVVSRGRAGPEVRIHMDRNDAVETVPTANGGGTAQGYHFEMTTPEPSQVGPREGPEQVKSTLDCLKDAVDAHKQSFLSLKSAKDCHDRAPSEHTRSMLKDCVANHDVSTKALEDCHMRLASEAAARRLPVKLDSAEVIDLTPPPSFETEASPFKVA